MDKIVQCCYTRLGGQSLSAGWQTVAASPDLPAEIERAYILLQNQNIPDGAANIGETTQVMTELVSSNDYLFLTRIRYGLADELGRQNNMFAHSFIFSFKDTEVLKDPNRFLTVSGDNFKEDLEAAGQIPDAFIRTAPYTLAGAMELCGLNRESYRLLIQCVFAQRMGSSIKPLYIHCSGDEKILRALLYCIYVGIPYFMRRTLSCATSAIGGGAKRDLILSGNHGNTDYYFDPADGSNNILTPKLVSRFGRLGYIDYFALHACGAEDADLAGYFDRLETTAVSLGEPTAAHPSILKIAHQLALGMDMDSLSEGELSEKLYDALTAKSKGSDELDAYITRLLERIDKQNLKLADEVEENLFYRLGQTHHEGLLKEGELYSINRLCHMPVDEAAKKLAGLADTESIFYSYSRKLADMPVGAEILDLYYSEYRVSQDRDWEELARTIDEISYLKKKTLTIDAIDAEAWSRYQTALEVGKNPMEAYEQYGTVMQKLLNENRYLECLDGAREEYWEHYCLKEFTMDKAVEYHFFALDGNDNSMFVSDLMEVLKIAGTEKPDEGLKAVCTFAARHKEQLQEEDKTLLLQFLKEENARFDTPQEVKSKSRWYTMAIYSGDMEVVSEAADLEECLKKGETKNFCEDYNGLCQKIIHLGDNKARIVASLNEILLATGIKRDRQNNVPLDIWLAIGSKSFPNPFKFFEGKNLSVMEKEAEEAVADSILFKQEFFRNEAVSYVKSSAPQAKLVNSWLKAVARLEKKQKASERHSQKESGESAGGLFNKIVKKVNSSKK